MTITTEATRVEHTGDGSTLPFAVPFKFLVKTDLVVVLRTIATGVDAVQTLYTDYTVLGAGDASGTVTFVTAPTSAQRVVIYNDPPLTQLVDYQSGDTFPAETHEEALDRLTLQQKRTREITTRAILLPDADTDGSGAYDAKSNRISSLGTPTATTDATTKTYVDVLVNNTALGPAPTGLIATGSVTSRLLADRWGEIKNVKDFGAVGDGVTDDTAAIQAAVDAVNAGGGGTAYIPATTNFYSITSPLVMKSNVTMKGDGYSSWIQNVTTSGGSWGEEMVVTMGTMSAGDFIRETAYTMTLAVKGGNTFTVTGNGSNFTAGDLIYLHSSEEASTDVPLKTEICEVKSVAGDVVTTSRPLMFSYDGTTPSARVSTNTVAWYDGVHNISIIKNAALVDLRLTTNENSTEAWFRHGGMYECNFEGLFTSGSYGLGCNGFAYSTMSRCHMEFGVTALETARYSVGSTISDCTLSYDESNDSGATHNVVFFSESCHNIKIHDCIIDVGTRGNGGLVSGLVAYAGSFSGCSFANNTMKSGVNDGGTSGYFIDYKPLDASNSGQTVWNNNVVGGNVFDLPLVESITGIRVVGETGSGRLMESAHLTVSNNNFYCPQMVASSGAIRFTGTNPNNHVMEGNHFSAGNIVPSATGYANTITNTSWDVRPFAQTQISTDVTPSVLGVDYLRTTVASAKSISNLDDGYDGQVVTVVVYGDSFTMVHGGSGLLNLKGGHDFSPAIGSTITLVFDGTSWYETGRTDSESDTIYTLADNATPTVQGMRLAITGGTTTIEDFDDGTVGQTITVLAEHALIITDGTHIILNGSADFAMAVSDSLTLVLKADNKWYETGRTVSAQTVFTGSTTHTFGSVGTWVTATHSVTCTGATAGMMVDVGLSSQGAATNPGSILLTGHVPTAGGSVLVSLVNTHGSPNVVGSGTLTVRAYSN